MKDESEEINEFDIEFLEPQKTFVQYERARKKKERTEKVCKLVGGAIVIILIVIATFVKR